MVVLASEVISHQPSAPGSVLAVLLTGDASTSNEPVELVRLSLYQKKKVIESEKTAELFRQRQLSELLSMCQGTKETRISPIFLGVKQAVADLRARGCQKDSGCELFVDTDGQENVEPQVQHAVTGKETHRIKLPAKIPNQGVKVEICGLAATTSDASRGRSATSAVVPQVWFLLFSNPDLVELRPFCN